MESVAVRTNAAAVAGGSLLRLARDSSRAGRLDDAAVLLLQPLEAAVKEGAAGLRGVGGAPPQRSVAEVAAAAAAAAVAAGTTTLAGAAAVARAAGAGTPLVASPLEPPLPAAFGCASHLAPSASGSYVLAVTPAGVVLMTPPSAAEISARLTPPPTPTRVVGAALPAYQVAAPLWAAWHPLAGDGHFLVLSADGLRMFDAGTDCDVPYAEWLFPVGAGAACSGTPTAFCFGGLRGWEVATVFVLYDTGDVAYVTPIVPYGCLLPAADWEELAGAAAAVAHLAPGDASPAAALAARLTAAWLHDCWAVAGGSDGAWRRYLPPPDSCWAGGVAGARRDDAILPALQGAVVLTPALAPPPRYHGAVAPPAAVALVAVPAIACQFPALSLLWADGRLVTVGCGDAILPAWGVAAATATGGGGGVEAVPAGSHVSAALAARDGVAPRTGADADGAAPWLVLDALALALPHPQEVALTALRSDGGTFPGAPRGGGTNVVLPPAAALRSGGGGSDGGGSGGAVVDLVAVPWLARHEAQPGVVVVVARDAAFLVAQPWLPYARLLLAGELDDAAAWAAAHAGARTSAVTRVLADAGVDIVGAATVGSRLQAPTAAMPEALLLWCVPRASAAVWQRGGGGGGVLTGSLHMHAVADAGVTAEAVALASAATAPRAPVGDAGPLAAFLATPPLEAQLAALRPALDAIAVAPLPPPPAGGGDAELAAFFNAQVSRIMSSAAAVAEYKNAVHARARIVAATVNDATAKAAAVAADHERLAARGTELAARLARLEESAASLQQVAEALALALSLLFSVVSNEEKAYLAELRAAVAELKGRCRAGVDALRATVDAAAVPPARGAAGGVLSPLPAGAALATPGRGAGGVGASPALRTPGTPSVQLRDVSKVLERARGGGGGGGGGAPATGITGVQLERVRGAEVAVVHAVAARQVEWSQLKTLLADLAAAVARFKEEALAARFRVPSAATPLRDDGLS